MKIVFPEENFVFGEQFKGLLAGVRAGLPEGAAGAEKEESVS